MNDGAPQRPSAGALIRLFAFALSLRVVYAVAMYAFAGAEALKGPDSHA